MEIINREMWLNEMAKKLYVRFSEQGYEKTPEKIRISCSFPSRGAFSESNRVLGQCWSNETSEDDTIEIMISHTVSDSIRVADILTHELVHAFVGNAAGHGKIFRKCALAIGLQGKMTSTYAGPQLTEFFKECIEELGEYPHASLNSKKKKKKQGTRQLKLVCKDGHDEYIVRLSKQTYEAGIPLCGLCHKAMNLQ